MSKLLQQLNNEMSTVVDNVRRSLVRVNNGRNGAGAGTLWHPEGLIFIKKLFQGYKGLPNS